MAAASARSGSSERIGPVKAIQNLDLRQGEQRLPFPSRPVQGASPEPSFLDRLAVSCYHWNGTMSLKFGTTGGRA